MRVGLAHDWLVGRRGGELVLDAIFNLLDRDGHSISKIYTMFDFGEPITPAIDRQSKVVSKLNSLPPWLRRWQLFRYPKAVDWLSKQLLADHQDEPIDLLISTHSAAIKAIKPPSPSVPHICYCHAPARYLWSQGRAYGSSDLVGTLRSLGLRAATPTLRRWDRAAADAVTAFIANSTHTQSQIKQFYSRDCEVIHPPVRTDFFVPADTPKAGNLLLVSALEPYKRVDLAIEAAAIANRELLIVGSGSIENQLRRHALKIRAKMNATEPIRFLGQLSDQQLLTQYQSADAFLFPQIEDFGITAVEAQAAGCPVIARRAGGSLDTVIDNQTGTFFDDPTPEAIAQAITDLHHDADTPNKCRDNALRFSEQAFGERVHSLIAKVCLLG